MSTTKQLAEALARAWPQLAGTEGDAQGLAREAARGLRRWGHDDHDIRVERVSRILGEPGFLHCLFWCESCHVSQLLVLSETEFR